MWTVVGGVFWKPSVTRLFGNIPTKEIITSVVADIQTEYVELDSIGTYIDTIDASAKKWLKEKEGTPELFQGLSDFDDLEERFEWLAVRARQIRAAKAGLAQRAEQENLLLVLKDTLVPQPGIPERKLEAGKLYRPFKRVFTWTTVESRIKREIDWGIRRYGQVKFVWENVHVEHSQEGTDYEEIKDAPTPWIEEINRITNKQKKLFMMRAEGDEYTTEDGLTLSRILSRCNDDETFRKDVVVALPFYRSSLTRGNTLAGYCFLHRPLPPIMSRALPAIYLRDTLGYAMAWKKAELGKLMTSINLAPGEERTVNISSSVESQKAVIMSRALGVETALAGKAGSVRFFVCEAR